MAEASAIRSDAQPAEPAAQRPANDPFPERRARRRRSTRRTPRRVQHEEHINHERWAIPYGDLITLLLAFFVVMYSISQVNEGKYRVLAQSIATAFSGIPHVVEPIQAGEQPTQSPLISTIQSLQPAAPDGSPVPRMLVKPAAPGLPPVTDDKPPPQLAHVADDMQKALEALVDAHQVLIKRHAQWVEVEISTDILFPSGVAELTPQAQDALGRIAGILAPLSNPLRVEGYTDDKPIHTAQFPSNWELSAARAASVARLFIAHGVAPQRLAVIGWGAYRPVTSNDTAAGRNANRRVEILILGGTRLPDRFYDNAPMGSGASAGDAAGQDAGAAEHAP